MCESIPGIFCALLLSLAPMSALLAADAGKEKPAAPVKFVIAKPVEGYQPVVSAANIAPTPGTVEDPNAKVEVFGQPRMAKGHPCTLWDQEDIDHIKELLKTDENVQKQLAWIVRNADKRITQPLNVPATHQAPDGKWMNPGDFPEDEPPHKKQTTNSIANSVSMAELATAYALTGEAKYGEYCRKMFLAYAENFPRWARTAGNPWRSASDGRLSYQFLNDGSFLATVAWAYDLIYNLPSFTAEDRVKIRDQFFKPITTEFFHRTYESRDYLSTPDNRSALCAAAVLLAGYATEDQDLIDFALHGHNGSKLQPTPTEGLGVKSLEDELVIRPNEPKAPGGLMEVHYSSNCLLEDGLWVEGSPFYSLSIAGCALFDTAEVLWRHGVDMYQYRNGVLKRLLDSGLLLANPGGSLTVPALRDSGPFALLDKADWLNGQLGSLYACGYRRYHQPQYLPVIRNGAAHLGMTTHNGPPLIKDGMPEPSEASNVPLQNVNFHATGYGILRIAEGERVNSLLMQFGSKAGWSGHDHPSQLGIDLYAFGDTLMPFPGVIFPYNDPLDAKWYWTTLANCTLEVDEDDQLDFGDHWHKYLGAPEPTIPQLVYAPAATLGMQRAYSSSAYPGTTMDRSLFMTSRYVADLFGGFSSVPRTYDLAWHFRGALTTDLSLAEMKFPDPDKNGYNGLDNVRHAETDGAWSAAVTFHDKPLRFLAAAGSGTDVIVGDGHFNGHADHPPAILERRVKKNNALYGNVMDLSGETGGYVKEVHQKGGLEEGYGLLEIQTTRGVDLCFTAYRQGSYHAGALETDAQQAFVLMDGQAVQAMYLAGGKTLKVADGAIERSEPGLAYVEKLTNESYVVANPSSAKATVTVTLPALGGTKSLELEPGGKWTSTPATAK